METTKLRQPAQGLEIKRYTQSMSMPFVVPVCVVWYTDSTPVWGKHKATYIYYDFEAEMLSLT